MKRIFTYTFSFLLSFLFIQTTHAQVVINEISAANRNTIFDNFGEDEDWIELYNAGSSTVNLAGYYLSDNINNPTKWEIPTGVDIDAGEYLLFFASGRDMVGGGFIHTSFKITQTKNEAVILSNTSGTPIDDYIIVTPNQLDQSAARMSDGSGAWGVSVNPTPGGPNANVFDHYAADATMSQEAGFYPSGLNLTLSTSEANSEIRYTTNGNDPSATSALYDGPINISTTSIVRAKVFSNDPNVLPGFIESNTYFVMEPHTVKVISIAGTDVPDLLDGDQFEPIGSFEYFSDAGDFIDEAVGEYNKHGNDSWAYPQRGLDYITRDQYGYNDDIDDEVFPTKERNDYQRFIIKAAANDNYPFEEGAHIRDAYVHMLSQYADMELDERTWEPCVMYVNGEYWGVYELREKVDDHDYTKEYYNQGKEWIDFIKTWGGTWEEYGSINDWNDLHDFILNEDMADADNYAYVETQLNTQSLVDYMILNTHIVCADWLVWNTAWWRGRKPTGQAQQWRYALWDMDASFGHYINYTNVPDTGPLADPCDNEDISFGNDPEGHVQMVQNLLENETFHSLYVNRYADMNNSFFTCDYMLGLLDEMIGRIEPEMPAQIERWGGSMSGWEANVQELRDFITARCTVINDGIVDCYDVVGPFPITVNISPSDSPNAVKVNTFVPESFPFSGDYFGNTTLNFEAIPDAEWAFDHWEVATAIFSPNEFAEAIQMSILEDETITAYFVPLEPCAAPLNVEVNPNFTTAFINWSGPSTALAYEVKIRETGSGADWEVSATTETEKTFFGLTECTDYDVEIRTICSAATSNILGFTFTSECVNAINEAQLLNEFVAYPNPFQDQLTVDLVLSKQVDARLYLYTINGQQVYEQDLPNLSVGTHRIPVAVQSDWANGAYIVRIEAGEENKMLQVMRVK